MIDSDPALFTATPTDFDSFSYYMDQHMSKVGKLRGKSTAQLSNGQRTHFPDAARPTVTHPVYMPLC